MVTKSKAKNGPSTKSASTTKSVPMKATASTKSSAPASKPDFKAAAAADQPEPATTAEPKTDTVAASKAAPKAEPPKEEEKLGVKLRRKADVMLALRAGSTLVLMPEGLYRMVNSDGSRNPVSKRRASAIVAAGLVKLTKANGNGKHYVFDPEAEKKAAEAKTPPASSAGSAPTK